MDFGKTFKMTQDDLQERIKDDLQDSVDACLANDLPMLVVTFEEGPDKDTFGAKLTGFQVSDRRVAGFIIATLNQRPGIAAMVTEYQLNEAVEQAKRNRKQ